MLHSKHQSCIVSLISTSGEINYKIFSVSLAQAWGLNIIYEGTYEECYEKLPELNDSVGCGYKLGING